MFWLRAARWTGLLVLLLWSRVGLAAHLPPGLEPRVVALLEGPELAALGLRTGDIVISGQQIALSVADNTGQTLGKLLLVQAGLGAKAVLRSPSFDLVWQGQPTPAVLQWLQAVVQRETGVWWQEDQALVAAEATEAPRVAPQTLVFAGGWLLLVTLLLVSVVFKPLQWPSLLAFGLVGLPLVAAAHWTTAAIAPVPAWEAAAAGRPADAIGALGAVLRWQFGLRATLGSEVVAAAVAGLCVLVGHKVAKWQGHKAGSARRYNVWVVATTGLAAGTGCVLLWNLGPGAANWLLAPLLAVVCLPGAAFALPTWLTCWVASAILGGADPWSQAWAVVCAALLARQGWLAWKLQLPLVVAEPL